MPTLFIDRIVCPQCKLLQTALVTHTKGHPWPTYIHVCTGCGYVIMESEWFTVPKPPKTREGPTQCTKLS